MLTAVASLAAAALALHAPGAATTTVTCGMTVTTSITVDNDLNNCSGDGLIVGASNITINLNGHTIDGDDTFRSVGFRTSGTTTRR